MFLRHDLTGLVAGVHFGEEMNCLAKLCVSFLVSDFSIAECISATEKKWYGC